MAERPVNSIFERHLQTAIQALLVALLAWSGLKLVSLGEGAAVLQERLAYQGQQISSLRQDLRNWSEIYYRKSDAAREFGELHDDMRTVKERVTTLEEQRP